MTSYRPVSRLAPGDLVVYQGRVREVAYTVPIMFFNGFKLDTVTVWWTDAASDGKGRDGVALNAGRWLPVLSLDTPDDARHAVPTHRTDDVNGAHDMDTIDMVMIAPGLFGEPEDRPDPQEYLDPADRAEVEDPDYAWEGIVKVRVYRDEARALGEEGSWHVDGVDANGNYTEEVEPFDTWEMAMAFAPIMIKMFKVQGRWEGRTPRYVYDVPVHVSVVARTEDEAVALVDAALPMTAMLSDGPSPVSVGWVDAEDVMCVAPVEVA